MHNININWAVNSGSSTVHAPKIFMSAIVPWAGPGPLPTLNDLRIIQNVSYTI